MTQVQLVTSLQSSESSRSHFLFFFFSLEACRYREMDVIDCAFYNWLISGCLFTINTIIINAHIHVKYWFYERASHNKTIPVHFEGLRPSNSRLKHCWCFFLLQLVGKFRSHFCWYPSVQVLKLLEISIEHLLYCISIWKMTE